MDPARGRQKNRRVEPVISGKAVSTGLGTQIAAT